MVGPKTQGSGFTVILSHRHGGRAGTNVPHDGEDDMEKPRTHHGGDKDDFSGTLKSVFDWELCSTSGFP